MSPSRPQFQISLPKPNRLALLKKTLTMSMLEEKYLSESWVRVYTDRSATNATTKGGAGIYIQYPNGEQQSEAIPTGLHCSSYKAIIHTAHTIKCKVDNNTQVVFLTDALSVLQALMNDNLPQLEQVLYTIKTLRTVLQWIPSHCGVHGNGQADRLTKHGAGQQQQENPACLTKIKTIIKSLFKTHQQQDSYHQLTRSDQATIFRLRTGHNRLNQHLNRVMKIMSSPMCSCG
jgi:ribonuclease HI